VHGKIRIRIVQQTTRLFLYHVHGTAQNRPMASHLPSSNRLPGTFTSVCTIRRSSDPHRFLRTKSGPLGSKYRPSIRAHTSRLKRGLLPKWSWHHRPTARLRTARLRLWQKPVFAPLPDALQTPESPPLARLGKFAIPYISMTTFPDRPCANVAYAASVSRSKNR